MTKKLFCLTLSFLFCYIAWAKTQIGPPICKDITSEEAPFFVSDTYRQGILEYENFRSFDNAREIAGFIPRGSIVYTPPELMAADTERRRVPVKVLNVNKELSETASKARNNPVGNFFRSLFSRQKGVEQVEAGDIGYLDNKSLKQAGEFTFYLEKDAPLYNSPSGVPLNDKKIKPRMENDQYMIRNCCFLLPEMEEEYCFDFHLFDILDQNDELIETTVLKGLGCGFFGSLDAVPDQFDDGVGSIYKLMLENPSEQLGKLGTGDLELFQKDTASGNIPLVKIPVDEETGFGPFNMRKYNSERGYTDNFLHPVSACAFLRVAQRWEQICNEPGCEIQFGNTYMHDDWGPHSTHDSGYCIDMRPFRKDNDESIGHTYRSGEYDYEKSLKFTKLLMEAGAHMVIFGDSRIAAATNKKSVRDEVRPGVTNPNNYWWKHRIQDDDSGVHNNHFHFCFDPKEKFVNDTCAGELVKEENP